MIRPYTAAVLCLGVSATIGCAARHAPAPSTAAAQRTDSSYIDLEPGWRLRVVTPILKSGGYRLRVTGETAGNAPMALCAGDDFLGYEVAFYAVGTRSVLEFQSAEIIRDGKSTPRPVPIADLFHLPRAVRHVRLIYLVRNSQADHDMALAAAKDIDDLESLTHRVQANTADACGNARDIFCVWIPAGIAVVPEARKTINRTIEWVPTR